LSEQVLKTGKVPIFVPFTADMKKTLVLGATTDENRYASLCVERLLDHGHEVVPVGIKKGETHGIKIINDLPAIEGVDTVTMYVGARNQPQYYDFLLGLAPRRIIFNPGAENDELARLASEKGIQVMEACTLVLLSVGKY
jgi:predicted CoA-binding protein